MTLLQVADLKKLKDGEMVEVTIRNKKVLLLNHHGAIRAYQGECPHEGASLAQGHIENGHIVCPLHHRNFSCLTGKHDQSLLCLKIYTVVEKGGQIFLEEGEFKPDSSGQHFQSAKGIDDLPSPKGNFFLGHLPQFNVPTRHLVLEKWAKEHGDLYQINFVGKKFIVSADPDINRHILKNRPNSFRRLGKINEVFEEMGIIGAFNAEGETWEKHRKVIAEALNVKNIRSYFPVIARMTERLQRRWINLCQSGQLIDVQTDLMRYTVDITTNISFGYDTNTLEKDDDVVQRYLEKIFPMINHRVTAPLPLWRFIKTKRDKAFDHALSEVRKTVNGFITEARLRLDKEPALREDPSNFLEALLVQQQTEGNFSDKEVFGNVLTILLAGEDTTSNSISWILYYLARHQETTLKIREETEAIFPAQPFPNTYNLAKALTYTEAVVQEVLRLKPVTPLLYMEALEDVEIKGLLIKKGEKILLQNKVAHTAEKYFSEPDKFLPERWISGKCPFIAEHNTEVIHTFGNGPRFCPGKNLAMLEMVVATAMVCKNFDFELAVDPGEIKEVFSFTMYPENLVLKMKRREANVNAEVITEKV